MDSKPATLVLPDNRLLAYATYGVPSKESKHTPAFYFTGFPGSHSECGLIHKTAVKLGIHIVAIDRPGFGGSTFQENRTFLDWPNDVLKLADHLSMEEFAVIGVSGGCPYVLACMKEISPDRLKAATIVSGVYPVSFGTQGMMMKSRILLWAASWSTMVVETLLDLVLGRPARDEENPGRFLKLLEDDLMGGGRPEVEIKALRQVLDDPEMGPYFVGSVRESIKTSCHGAAWEAWLFASDWGFELEGMDARRLTIWHGALDINTPVIMADTATKLLKDAEFKRFEDESHFSLPVNHAEAILSDLVTRAGSAFVEVTSQQS
jgi:pimeloyl-ACP methyl ester carboxylesterase